MFLLPILIPACNSSSPAVLMLCSAYRLNRVTADNTIVLLSQSFFFFVCLFSSSHLHLLYYSYSKSILQVRLCYCCPVGKSFPTLCDPMTCSTQGSLSFSISPSLLKFIFIESMMLSNHIIWRRQWHPAPVLLPGKSHGWRRLVGCSPWGR